MPHTLSERTSLFLDFSRASAAIYVALHHVVKDFIGFDGLWNLFRFGQEAVLIFFLMSGFVIYASEHGRALDLRGYLFRRVRRIYPPLLVAFCVSAAVAQYNGTFAREFDWVNLGGNILALQDLAGLKPGTITEPFLANDPLWSLSYEVAFYLMFPAALLLLQIAPRAASHLIGLGAVACFAVYTVFPHHFLAVAAYFQIWWTGAMIAASYLKGGRSWATIGPAFWWLAVLTIAAAVNCAFAGIGKIWSYPVLPFRHFIVALVFVLVVFSRPGNRIIQTVALPRAATRYAASISYAVYLLHFPILIQWQVSHSPAGFAFSLVLLIVLSHATERWLYRVLPRFPARTPA
ncbi:acyltransferase family protein [Leisingera sp. ANG-DT]|uniref:acyltransferase family protein n=1 Tax=Leisingera sp. ANG-DT TaxID=1577897 RepID=UPI00068E8AA7|nr:acyltransferase [Leisingera sp. ANG-DT]